MTRTFTENGGRPADERGFIHKSSLGKFVRGAVGDVAGAIPGIGTAVTTIRTGIAGVKALTRSKEKELGARLKFPEGTFANRPGRSGRGFLPAGLGEGCPEPLILSPQGNCIAPTSPRGAELFMGEAVMGQYGAALVPGTKLIDRAICLRGMQLGNDGLCYNKSQIKNNQRMWPAGRKPLLSGGDMRAISIAARAGRRLEGATKRLQRLGMMKKPASRRAPPHAHARAAKGVVSV